MTGQLQGERSSQNFYSLAGIRTQDVLGEFPLCFRCTGNGNVTYDPFRSTVLHAASWFFSYVETISVIKKFLHVLQCMRSSAHCIANCMCNLKSYKKCKKVWSSFLHVGFFANYSAVSPRVIQQWLRWPLKQRKSCHFAGNRTQVFCTVRDFFQTRSL